MFPERLLFNLTERQKQTVSRVFSQPATSTQEKAAIAEGALNSPAGTEWRDDIARWMAGLFQIDWLVPEVYRDWSLLIEDSVFFLISHLSPSRLARKFVEQLDLPEETLAPFRLLVLLARMPGLQKLGQTVARNRHLDPELRAALSELENSISDTDFETIHRVVKHDLGSKLEAAGAEIQRSILSEASVSAVVRFTWKDPESHTKQRGVLKILKPHVPACFAEDMQLLEGLAEFVAARQDKYGLIVNYLPDTFREVRALLEREIDFAGEQRKLADAAASYSASEAVRVPEVIASLSNHRITAMTEECCVKITEASSPRRRRAEQLVEALIAYPLFSRQPLAMFHADPHAGNLLYDDEKRKLIILDWALAEYLTRAQRRHILMLTIMLGLRDETGVWRELQSLSGDASPARADVRCLISEFLSEQPVFKLPGSLDAMRLLDSLAMNGVKFPSALLMFRKALFTLDGVIHDVTGDDTGLDSLLLSSAISRLAANWWALFSPEDWIAAQSSVLLYANRLCISLAMQTGLLPAPPQAAIQRNATGS